MWEVLRRAHRIAVVSVIAIASLGVEANAQDTFINQNISGFNLPGVQLPQGHDEVRAADGTTCRSAVSGSGAYLDVGVIGNPEQNDADASFSAYGRMVIPLGKTGKRLDCSKLYALEVQRLEMELKLMQMGLTRGIAPVSEGTSSNDDDSDIPADGEVSIDTADTGEQPETEEVKVASAQSVKTDAETETTWADEGWSTDGLKK